MAHIVRTTAIARRSLARWRWTTAIATAMVAVAAVPAHAVQIRVPRFSPPRIEVQPPIGAEPAAVRDALESAQPTLRERFNASAAQITTDPQRRELLKECLSNAAEEATEEFVGAIADAIPADYDALQAAGARGCVTSVFPEAVQYRIDQVSDSLAGQADAIGSEAIAAAGTSTSSLDDGEEEIDPPPEDEKDGSSPLVWIIVGVLLVGGVLFVLMRGRAAR